MTDAEDAMDSLIGRSLVEWGRDEEMFHLVLDDGRTLIFIALGILSASDYAVH